MNPLYEENQRQYAEPCALVIFGATGDLTARKLIPALYNLLQGGCLPSQFACVGFARRDKTDAQFRQEMFDSTKRFLPREIDESIWNHFQDHLFYHRSEFHDDEGYIRLKKQLQDLDHKFGCKGNRIFYLATPPSYFSLISEKLKKNDLLTEVVVSSHKTEKEENIFSEKSSKPWSRIIIEKPFGHDLASAEKLQKEILACASENQIFRIDHYLGKETVQNLLVFRFSNSIFEPLWNNENIDHIQITVAEEQGIGSRGKFWEETGLVRDVVQNHAMQLLSLVAMEKPINFTADAIRDEKVKVLQSIRPLKQADVVKGQYSAGFINGEDVIGYREEQDVSKTSSVETYAALKIHIDNKRWEGTPFYIRSGKRLPKRATEIAIIFKNSAETYPGHEASSILGGFLANFRSFLRGLYTQLILPPQKKSEIGSKSPQNRQKLMAGIGSNTLVIRIQPDEGISLKINCKVPGPAGPTQPVKMDFKYGSYFGAAPPEAYERLFCDAMIGDPTLFARQDEVLLSWKLLTPILDKPSESNYAAGSWGPEAADQLLAQDNRAWRLI